MVRLSYLVTGKADVGVSFRAWDLQRTHHKPRMRILTNAFGYRGSGSSVGQVLLRDPANGAEPR